MATAQRAAADTADLLLTLHQGAFDEPLWSSFLATLRAQARAEYAGLIIRCGEGAMADVTVLQSDPFPPELGPAVVKSFYRRNRGPYHQMISGRVYSTQALYQVAGVDLAHFYEDIVAPAGMPYGRLLRVEEPSGGEAWCAVARGCEDFGTDADLLLSELAPHLQVALRTFMLVQRERIRAGVSADVVQRLNLAWFTLDGAGRVVGMDGQGEQLLTSSTLKLAPDGRLLTRRATADRRLAELLRAARRGEPVNACLIHLSEEPWRDMLVAPVTPEASFSGGRPVLALYVAGDHRSETERCEQLKSLFKLSSNEARLALALSRGRTIAQSAEDLGICEGSARTYSKRLYAKAGVHGKADLVRLIVGSVIALA